MKTFTVLVCFVLCLVEVFSETADVDRCPTHLARDKYLRTFRQRCYQFMTFQQRNWHVAEKECEHHGGHLIAVEDAATQRFVDGVLDDLHWHHTGLWIGLNDLHTEGHYVWTTGQASKFFHWGPHEPTFLLHIFEDCVLIDRDDHYKWEDHICTGQNGYACQFDMLPKKTTTLTPTTRKLDTEATTSTTLSTSTPATTTTVTETPPTPVSTSTTATTTTTTRTTTKVPETPSTSMPTSTTTTIVTETPTTPMPTTTTTTIVTETPTTPMPTTTTTTIVTETPSTPMPTTTTTMLVTSTPMPTSTATTIKATTTKPTTAQYVPTTVTVKATETSTATITTTTKTPMPVTDFDPCGDFECTLDCSETGFQIDNDGCPLCLCA